MNKVKVDFNVLGVRMESWVGGEICGTNVVTP